MHCLCEFDSFYFIFSHCKYFLVHFGHFWPPTVPHTGPMVPIWNITPKYITWVWNPPKSGPWLLILFSISIFPPLQSFLAIFNLWGAFWRPSWAPAMACCVLPVPICSWVLKCAILETSGQKECANIIMILFLALKSRFLSLLCGFNPLLRPKIPECSPYGLIPLS